MTDRFVSVRFDDLAFALERMAFGGCMCREGSDGACVCDYSQREDRQVAKRLSDALTGEQPCPTCGGRGWHTAGGNDPSACACEAGAAWSGERNDA